MKQKCWIIFGVIFIILGSIIPVEATTTIVGTEVYSKIHKSWSGVDKCTLVRTVRPTAGGDTPSVTVTIPWDNLAVVSLIVTRLYSGVKTNTGDKLKFTEAMGSVFFGKGSYHSFSGPTWSGYEEYWIVPTEMYGYGGKTGTTITKTYTLTVYAKSETEAETKVKAGFDLLGIGAEVSVRVVGTAGVEGRYTVEVKITQYKHYYTTIFQGTMHRHYHVEGSGILPMSTGSQKVKSVDNKNSRDLYEYKDFDFTRRHTFYSYEDVDLTSLGSRGTLTS
ncbi:hypothetical protein [Pyrococcus kukulkanii]|uniref:Uncharacterized protein n=2 Tax=Pyrococcus kukulkanii TaxID=1609559 RepID=A0A127BAC9_9EURY|nr:hypothetical protein [Pyrococcus kukulkanii]AMM53759.1 hypothetical protein TQ32_04125 [Pyrococcus kukulkanii]